MTTFGELVFKMLKGDVNLVKIVLMLIYTLFLYLGTQLICLWTSFKYSRSFLLYLLRRRMTRRRKEEIKSLSYVIPIEVCNLSFTIL